MPTMSAGGAAIALVAGRTTNAEVQPGGHGQIAHPGARSSGESGGKGAGATGMGSRVVGMGTGGGR